MSDKLTDHLQSEMKELRKDIRKLTEKLHKLEIRTVVLTTIIVGSANLISKFI